MTKILKYQSKLLASIELEMPKNAIILSVGIQQDAFTVWAIVNPENPTTIRKFRVFGTGWDYPPEPLMYLKTIFQNEFVWHIFEDVGIDK